VLWGIRQNSVRSPVKNKLSCFPWLASDADVAALRYAAAAAAAAAALGYLLLLLAAALASCCCGSHTFLTTAAAAAATRKKEEEATSHKPVRECSIGDGGSNWWWDVRSESRCTVGTLPLRCMQQTFLQGRNKCASIKKTDTAPL